MKVIKPLAGLALVLSMVACDQNMNDLEQYIQEVKARPAKPLEPIPEMKPYARFVYPRHELNPFDPKILAPEKAGNKGGNDIAPDPNRTPEFLENFPLDGLRMVGTVHQQGALWALIRIPDGAVHRAKVGNYLGKNHGKITKIEETRVTLMEIVENGFGGYKERENSIALSETTTKPQ